MSKSKSITETRELIAAIATIAKRILKGLANDGKVSPLEALGFWSDRKAITAGFSGVSAVPAELWDLTDEEIDTLRRDIYVALTDIGIDSPTSSLVDASLVWITQTGNFVKLILQPPPKAESA